MGTLRIHRNRAPASPELERAEAVLVLVVLAGIVPVLLGGILGTLARNAVPTAGSLAAVLLPLVVAAATLVRWVGMAILAALALGCTAASAYHFRHSHAPALHLSGWALAEAYGAAAVVALLGLYWLA